LFLERNLARLENRFLSRYRASVDKGKSRQEQGKQPHATTLQSIEENKKRLEAVKLIRRILFGNI
jgi:hypothetical protein